MIRAIAFTLVLSVVSLASVQDTHVPLSSLDLSKMTAGWGEPQADKNCMGQPMSIAGRTFERGVGTHADSLMHVELDGKVSRFTALVGVDSRTGERGTVSFQVYADGKKAFDSGPMKGGDPAKEVDVPLEGVRRLMLIVGSGGDDVSYDNANWAEAEFVCHGAKPVAVDAPALDEEKVILTPKPGPEPRINGPRLFGARPGHPFIYRIPCTGNRPMVFGVENLPDGLSVDENSGIITGKVPDQAGQYVVTLTARNDAGAAKKEFTLVVGDRLALTPPMGWNSWYIHYHRVTGKVMREAADVMVSSGMADYGYTYVNIDDCWMRIEPEYFEEVKGRLTGFDMTGVIGKIRDENGNILPNDNFADMAAMTDYIHSKGLRAGTYISPGPRTCQRYAGSFEHERQDAEQFAKWGFDFLKYDWCSYGQVYNERMKKRQDDLAEKKYPYEQMGAILKKLDRDIVLNLCQYGMADVWKWGGEVGGHCWRTTGDLGLHRGSRLPGFYHIGMSNAAHWKYAGPGRWNDPDYILIGWVGSARGHGIGKETTLTAGEQYSYMSMWSLMAAPLFFSGDMAKLDEFTLNILCNAEVIDVNQDALGKQAKPIVMDDETLLLAKPLEDGSLAVGLFNLLEQAREMTATWEQLGIKGKYRVRDVWRQREVGEVDGAYSAAVGRHGVMFLRMWPVGE
ncbi:MAG: alpha-galactosidase [Planctomycetaceae bacterium]|nr:alpha-galactosidase [Planctomycetaceae bacterium]